MSLLSNQPVQLPRLARDFEYEPRCEKAGLRFLTRSHTNQAVQPQKMAGGLKFSI